MTDPIRAIEKDLELQRKELELQRRELELKEKELHLKEKALGSGNTNTTNLYFQSSDGEKIPYKINQNLNNNSNASNEQYEDEYFTNGSGYVENYFVQNIVFMILSLFSMIVFLIIMYEEFYSIGMLDFISGNEYLLLLILIVSLIGWVILAKYAFKYARMNLSLENNKSIKTILLFVLSTLNFLLSVLFGFVIIVLMIFVKTAIRQK